jgi:glycosyltransferase involved in cell wall biosynthesis
MKKRPRADNVDVLLLSEGAYPYISGGVSSWVQTIIKNFADLKFGVVFLGSLPDDYDGLKYELPDNVVDFQEHYLFDFPEGRQKSVDDINDKNDERMQLLHDWFKNPTGDEEQELVGEMIDLFDSQNGITQEQFLHSPSSWDYITDCYERYSTEPSFIDYFWTVRNIHAPLWQVAELAPRLPKAKLIHSVATGYAGFLAALLKSYQQTPLVLSEHGIYTKERRIELLQSRIVKEQNQLTRTEDVDYLRRLWMRFFESMAMVCYELSDDITALYHGASERQRQDGAQEKKQHVIPNAIDVAALKKYRKKEPSKKKRICLLGRIVPIKDIKTFIRSIKYLSGHSQDFDVWLVGPEDEEEEYAQECKDLVKSLGLEKIVAFKGLMALDEVIPKVDIMVISSISEGMPLVIMEGYAAGIPAVSTNVGACEELVNGMTDDDIAIGPSGRMVKIFSPKDLAEGMLELFDDEKWKIASQAAIERVEKYYDLSSVIGAYTELYKKHGVM